MLQVKAATQGSIRVRDAEAGAAAARALQANPAAFAAAFARLVPASGAAAWEAAASNASGAAVSLHRADSTWTSSDAALAAVPVEVIASSHSEGLVGQSLRGSGALGAALAAAFASNAATAAELHRSGGWGAAGQVAPSLSIVAPVLVPVRYPRNSSTNISRECAAAAFGESRTALPDRHGAQVELGMPPSDALADALRFPALGAFVLGVDLSSALELASTRGADGPVTWGSPGLEVALLDVTQTALSSLGDPELLPAARQAPNNAPLQGVSGMPRVFPGLSACGNTSLAAGRTARLGEAARGFPAGMNATAAPLLRKCASEDGGEGGECILDSVEGGALLAKLNSKSRLELAFGSQADRQARLGSWVLDVAATESQEAAEALCGLAGEAVFVGSSRKATTQQDAPWSSSPSECQAFARAAQDCTTALSVGGVSLSDREGCMASYVVTAAGRQLLAVAVANRTWLAGASAASTHASASATLVIWSAVVVATSTVVVFSIFVWIVVLVARAGHPGSQDDATQVQPERPKRGSGSGHTAAPQPEDATIADLGAQVGARTARMRLAVSYSIHDVRNAVTASQGVMEMLRDEASAMRTELRSAIEVIGVTGLLKDLRHRAG